MDNSNSLVDEELVSLVRSFVESECKKPSANYGYELFTNHLVPMVRYADALSDKFEVNKKVVLIASWLHDIGSIIYGRKDHHITGAKIAEDFLLKINYPSEKIDLIKRCILNHRGSIDNVRESLEEQIVAEADALSNFDNLEGLFKVAFVYEKLSQPEARISVREKLIRKFDQLKFEESKQLVKPKLDAVLLLLE